MRDSKGRFLPGNPGSPGRPPRRVERQSLEMLTNFMTPAKWHKVIKQAYIDATEGDSFSRKAGREWLAGYCWGKPVTTINLNATEQAILGDLLDVLAERGIPASDVFAAMIEQASLAESVSDE